MIYTHDENGRLYAVDIRDRCTQRVTEDVLKTVGEYATSRRFHIVRANTADAALRYARMMADPINLGEILSGPLHDWPKA